MATSLTINPGPDLETEDHVSVPRLLVAARDVPLQEVFRDWLRLDGNEVTVADSGRAVLELAIDRGHYDVLIVDADMPRPSWRALLEQLRARGVTTPVILVSCELQLSKDERSKLSVGSVLRKPLPLHELSDAVRSTLRATPVPSVLGTGA